MILTQHIGEYFVSSNIDWLIFSEHMSGGNNYGGNNDGGNND